MMKNMKRMLALLLAGVMLVGMAACGGEKGEDSEAAEAHDQDNTDHSSVENADGSAAESLDIQSGSPFNEGMALVILSDEKLYGINEKGEIQFCLGEGYSLPASASDRGYIGGLASVCGKDTHYLCDKQGNIISAEQYGGTSFDYSNLEAVTYDSLRKDGFILIENEENETLGVLDPSFEWLVPMSVEFRELYNDYQTNYEHYSNGYIFASDFFENKWSYLNLRNGQTGTDLTEVELKHSSDLYYLDYRSDGREVVDMGTGEAVFDVQSDSALVGGGYFADGKLLVMEWVRAGENMMRYYVIDDRGEYVTQPKEKESKLNSAMDGSVQLFDEILLLTYATTQTRYTANGDEEVLVDRIWETYDLKGNKLGRFELPEPEDEKVYIDSTNVIVRDGIVMIEAIYSGYDEENGYGYLDSQDCRYFTIDLKPLF